MGRYEVTGPDGSRYEIEAPDENALNEAVEQLFGGQGGAQNAPYPQADAMAPESYPQPSPFPTAPPEPSTMDRVGRNLRFGAQAVGEGAANILGFPVDAATALVVNPSIWAKNKIFGGDTPLLTEPLGGSAGLKRGVREMADAAGGAVDPDALGFKERAAFEGIGGATAALTGGAGLVREGARRVTEEAGKRLPRMLDTAVKPYVDNTGMALGRDIAGGVGSGFGLAGAQEVPDSIRETGGGSVGALADIIGSLAGGIGGMGALDFGRATATQAKTLAGAPFGAGVAKDIPLAPDGDWRPYTNRSADMAAEVYQGAATRPDAAPEFLRQNRADLEPTLGNRMPTSGALAEDPGLVALERRMATVDPNPMIRRDQALNAATRDAVDTVAPQGADPADLVNAARAEADRLRSTVQQQGDAQIADRQGRVDTVRGRAESVEGIRREDAAPLAPYQSADAAANASRRLDEAVVDQSYLPDRAEKNRLYQEGADPNAPLDTRAVAEAARSVAESAERLPQSIRGSQSAPALAEDLSARQNMTYGDAGATRQAMSSERNAARASGDFGRADAIGEIQRPLNEALDAANPQASANYRENFAPKYRAGPGDEMQRFTKDIDRDSTRSTTPPSETAGRFLSGPEKIASLRRVLDSSPAGEAGNAAVRDYLLADLATSGVLDQKSGAIRPDRLRAWRNQWGSNLDAAPGFGREVDDMIARAAQGERVSGGLAAQVKRAEEQLRDTAKRAGRDVAEVDARINKGALGMVLDADPDKTVAAIMSDTNKSARRLSELVDLTKNDEQARAGLKAAVRDYLVDKSTTTATEKLPAGDNRGPLSFAKVQKLFNEHEAQLAQVFSPEEMNSLRVVHKALEVQNLERVRVRSGSDTVEKLAQGSLEKFLDSPTGKAFEAVLRLKYGMLKGGGIVAMGRRYMAGLTPEDGNRAIELLQRAAFDPDLATLLATRKIPPGSPQYNRLIQNALAGSAAARAVTEDDEPKKP